MLKIALTGNIASGKSSVQLFLEEKSYPVLDTDIVCHELLENSVEIAEAFSEYDVFHDGILSREKLGQLVFSDSKLKKMLENLLYPDLIAEIQAFFAVNSDSKLVFVGIPQLFEAGMENLFDRTILVYCDDKIREQRLIARNKYTKEYAQIRMKSQLSQDIKAKKVDYIIYNNSTMDDLHSNIIKVIEQIR